MMTASRRHVNIPVFIPHLGCPHRCIFCDQRQISGQTTFDPASVIPGIEARLQTIDFTRTDVEIAFFGGSFTAIPTEQIIALLQLVQPYLRSGHVQSLRCSTRPDALGENTLSILRDYGMTTVELGIQSLSDEVLKICRRGHSAAQSREACAAVKSAGLRLVGQMMLGLPASTAQRELDTARKLRQWGVDAVRIYPTAVFRGTELDKLRLAGKYTPLTLEQAVDRAADVTAVFLAPPEIPRLRTGLCVEDDLSHTQQTGGVYHPAFGEMVRSRLFSRMLRSALAAEGIAKDGGRGRMLTVQCPPGFASAAAGYCGENKVMLKTEFGFARIRFQENPSLPPYTVHVRPAPLPSALSPFCVPVSNHTSNHSEESPCD